MRRLTATAIAVALVATSCGDGATPPASTGYLVGGLIQHVRYSCGDQSGRTGPLGEFRFRADQSCTFRLGDAAWHVTSDDLRDRAVTPYELVDSPTSAWTLTAILDAISHRRPKTDLFFVADPVLEQRVARADLEDGDAAIETALAPFKGTLKQVSVASGRAHLGRFVDEGGRLIRTVEELVAEGRAILRELGTDTSGSHELGWEYNHDNRVNFILLDNDGNPLDVTSASIGSPNVCTDCQVCGPGPINCSSSGGGCWTDDDSACDCSGGCDCFTCDAGLSITSGQNPDGNVPVAGLDEGDLQGANIFGIDWDVGRKGSGGPANEFTEVAFEPSAVGVGSPITITVGAGAPSESDNTYFPSSLNFTIWSSMHFETSAGSFYCYDVLLGQGHTGGLLKSILNEVTDIAQTAFKSYKFIDSGGTSMKAAMGALKSFGKFTRTAESGAGDNWWMMGVSAYQSSYRSTAWGNPSMLMSCAVNGTVVAVMVYGFDDDHTFYLQVAFPGQELTIQK